jgi:hypothetical protein
MCQRIGFLLLILAAGTLGAQQFNAVPLEHTAYTIIEMGVLRGIIAPPHSARPWQEYTIKQKLREMLDAPAGKLSPRERDIVSGVLRSFVRDNGLARAAGSYRTETAFRGVRFSFAGGLCWESSLALGAPNPAAGSVNRGTLSLAGDIGEQVSWSVMPGIGSAHISRERLGLRTVPPDAYSRDGEYVPAESLPPVYAVPAFFPYTFSKRWDAVIVPSGDLDMRRDWPDEFAFTGEILSGLNASLFDNRMQLRLGRMRRDWGPAANGSSLFLNANARPFAAFEGTVIPFPWLRFSFLTGIPEYYSEDTQGQDADPYPNMLSLTYLEFDTGKYFHIDFGAAAVWPKRAEPGYVFPLAGNFLYRNNVGDFDNTALYANMEIRLPGIATFWGSLFVDEIHFGEDSFFNMDRQMYAYQGGIKAAVAWLPLGAFTLRYSKVEPYCYTSQSTETPWGSAPADTAYRTNGEPLGFYLPPNSDELLIRVEAAPLPGIQGHVQYQMIRHGAEYGYGAVDGSSLGDKRPDAYSSKYFLMDGVYQWDTVIKAGASYRFKISGVPLSIFAETGLVITRFTINGSAGIGNEADYETIDNTVYRAGIACIASIGFRIFGE